MDDLQLYCECDKALDSLIQTVRIFSEDIEMQIGIDKCPTYHFLWYLNLVVFGKRQSTGFIINDVSYFETFNSASLYIL